MPQVKLKVDYWLSQGLETNSAGFEEIPISVPGGESVLEMVPRLAAENGIFHRAIYDEEKKGI